MLSAKRESLAGKLLLSSALVAVSLAYGWWQTPAARGPAVAMAPTAAPPKTIAPLPQAPATPTEPVTQEAASGVKDAPSAPPPEKSAAIAKPQTAAPAAAPPEPQQTTDAPSSAPAPQPAQAVTPPADSASPPPMFVTGNPEPGVMAAVPAGMHLADGDFVSDKHGLMWGDLRVKISIHGGVITAMQALDFPDHRAQSLYLSQLALPTLESEVIKSQKSVVDVVSSATDTSYTFQDAVADALTKATRG